MKCVVGELVAAVSQRVDSDSIRDSRIQPKVPDLFVMKWHFAPAAGCKKSIYCYWLKLLLSKSAYLRRDACRA